MTTIRQTRRTCAVCGRRSRQSVVGSTYTSGYCDLDFRPPPLARYNLAYEVEACPSCGYCAPVLSKATAAAKIAAASPAYQALRARTDLPPLARDFLSMSHLQEVSGQYGEGGWAALSGAWAADDEERAEGAKDCRSKAADLFERVHKEKQEFMDEPAAECLVLADVHRRLGEFETARAWAEKGLVLEPGKPLNDVLRFEIQLTAAKDDRCHSMEEILGPHGEASSKET